MKRVLVSGATGFLGRHLQVRLRELGVTVVAVGSEPHRDTTDVASWKELLQAARPAAVFHLMGRIDALDDNAFDASHVLPTKALLTAAQIAGLDETPIFVLGSAAEYGNIPENRQPISEDESAHPTSAYGRSKLRATEVALEFATRGMRVAVVRLFNVFGPGMSAQLMPGALLTQLQRNPSALHTGPLDRVRDFLAVEVAMDALARLALVSVQSGAILNLCSGRGTSLREIVQTMAAAARFTGQIVEGGRDSVLSEGVRSCVGNPDRLTRILGFRPRIPTLSDFARLV